ncbi:MAG: hypothetical protein GX489_07790 [Firmicutes bacterium]|nr:hypothetical protein [Bacillota bacterium]
MANEAEDKVTLKGWIALFILIIMFSGVFENAEGPLKALDLSNLIGEFGTIGEGGNFRGTGGSGARDGFLFTLTLIPTTCLAVGLIDLVEHLGGLKAAAILFNPILRPLLGIPGIAGLAFVSSFTSSDIAAFMTKQLVEDGHMTDDERTVFVAYQYAGSAVVLNTIGTQAALLPIVLLPGGPLIVILWICKILGANLVRLIIKSSNKKAGEAA